MGRSSSFTRIVAGTIGFLCFGTNCLFAYSTESNIWAERRRAREQRSSPTLLASLPVGASPATLFSQFPPSQKIESSLSQTVARSVPKSFIKDHAALLAALSPAYGTIRKVSLSPKPSTLSPIVIHIQDVHQNLDAQMNIGQLVGSLINAHQATLIGLEGTWGDINLQPFRDFANRKAVEQSADYLLKENKISGPIHAAMIGTGPLPPLTGVDDSVHYNANVDAYRQSASRLETMKKELENQKTVLDQEKSRVFSEELKRFDKAVDSYRAGRSSLGDYVQVLTGPALHLSVPLSVQTFQKTFLLEKTMDFQKVEGERTALINLLVQKLGPPEINELTAQSVAYRSGNVGYADFYNFLQNLCFRSGVSLDSFPAMKEYIRYVLLADGITAETLLEDLMSLERSAYSQLAKTPKVQAVVNKARSAYLTGKLVDFSLTPEEWKEYRSLAPHQTTLSSFENFYREADARDRAMAENLLKAIHGTKGPRVSILVTGGYHAQGLSAQLTQAGATVISVVPKIEKLETTQGATYLSVFTQEKTPLDKLFAGEKLFLAQNPISKPTRQIVAPLLAVLGGILVGNTAGLVDINAAYHSLDGLGSLSNPTRGVGTVGITLTAGGSLFTAKIFRENSKTLPNFSITQKAPNQIKRIGLATKNWAARLSKLYGSIFKAAAMAVIYGTLITATPLLLFDFFQNPSLISGMLLAGWAAVLGIHRNFDSEHDPIREEKSLLASTNLSHFLRNALLIALSIIMFTVKAAPISPPFDGVNQPNSAESVSRILPTKVKISPELMEDEFHKRLDEFEHEIFESDSRSNSENIAKGGQRIVDLGPGAAPFLSDMVQHLSWRATDLALRFPSDKKHDWVNPTLKIIFQFGPLGIPAVYKIKDFARDTDLPVESIAIEKWLKKREPLFPSEYAKIKEVLGNDSQWMSGLWSYQNKNREILRETIKTCSQMGPRASELLPLLVRLSKDEGLGEAIDNAIDKLGPPPEEVIPSLIQILDSASDRKVLERAIEIVANVKPFKKASEILLADIVRHSEHAKLFLDTFLTKHSEEEVIPILVQILNNSTDDDVEFPAIKLLAKIKPFKKASEILFAYVERHPKRASARLVLDRLTDAYSGYEEGFDLLIRMPANSQTDREVLFRLEKLGAPRETAIPFLTDALNRGDSAGVPRKAINALGKIKTFRKSLRNTARRPSIKSRALRRHH
jgi:HEAT repeat protein